MTEYHVQQELGEWEILNLPLPALIQLSKGAKVYDFLGSIVRVVEANSHEEAIAKAKQFDKFRKHKQEQGTGQSIDVFPWTESVYEILQEAGWNPPTEPPQTSR